VIYDPLEQFFAALNANFATDMVALVTAKSLTGITTTATIIKRQTAEVIIAKRATQPTIGFYPTTFRTQAKDQGKRDTRCWLEVVYVATGEDPAAIGKQIELALESILRSVDRLAGLGGGVFGAAVEDNSIDGELSDYYVDGQAPNYYQTGTMRIPVDDRENGL
jgi:hypothetical protein